MSKDLIKKKKEPWWVETIDTAEAEIIEENFYVDESFIKNKELIRMDMNIVQYPIFSKNTKRKANQIVKYYFNKNRDTYITVSPKAGDYIPGEAEEKVFIALMQIMKEKGMPQKFIVLASELKERLNIVTKNYVSIIRGALLRLAETNYNFKNTMYSSDKNGTIKEEVSTPILMLKIITLSKKENIKYREQIEDRRIKEVYEIIVTDHFYQNIIQKGYMVYNSRILLEISTSTARTIYMLIEKLRFKNIYLKMDTMFLIKRIPLKYDKKNLNSTMKTLERAFTDLREKNLIKDFRILKETTWEKSEIEVFFDENVNDEKQGRFFKDRNDFREILSRDGISETEHSMIEEVEIIEHEKTKDIKVTAEIIEKILNSMPKKAKELKTMTKTIKEAIEKYGYHKVELVAKYMKEKKVDKVRAYFIKALENDWIKDEEIMPTKVDKKSIKESQLNFDINTPQYDEKLYIEFEKLPIEVQNGIETYAYRDYIKKCGIETKIQQLAFTGSRRKYICEYLEKYPEIFGKEEKEEKAPIKKKEEFLSNTVEIRQIILDIVDMSKMLKVYTDKEEKELIKTILEEVSVFIKNRNLTREKLDEILKKHTEI